MKISHFPDFLPGETVFSVASRYLDRMQFCSQSLVSQHFFDKTAKGITTDFPSNLEHLIQSLPPRHVYTVDILIDQHTLFPFYAPFLSYERRITLRQRMRTGGVALHSIAGITKSKVPRPQWLKYCPACVDHDRLTHGECYWHRIHQVPGVLVCSIHEIMLEDSSVNMLLGEGFTQYCSAEHSINNLQPRLIPVHLRLALLELANNVKWLLEHSVLVEQGYLHQQYLRLLAKHGLVTVTGRARYVKLKEAILDYYPANLLEVLGCDILQSQGNWLEVWTRIYHPLHHLLMIQFLCGTTQEFFTKSQHSPAPFGTGPWPCLNPLCPHYREYIITSCAVKQGSLNQPIATFACQCGFTYSRTGPDMDDKAIFRVGKVARFGDLWDQHLTTYWSDQTLSTSQVAKLMHADFKSICKQAARLDLPFAPDIPRRGKRPKIYQDYLKEQRELYQTLWEDALKAYPNAGVAELAKVAKKAYVWLQRHDIDWLKEHYPTTANRSLQRERLLLQAKQALISSYSLVDADLAAFVRKAAEEIYARLDFPVQVTRRLLVARIGHFTVLKRSTTTSNSLLLTANALDEVVETSTAFIWRKLVWTVQSYLTEQVFPSYASFLRRAHIGSSASVRPITQQLIQIAYQGLSTGTSLNGKMPEVYISRSEEAVNRGKTVNATAYHSLAAYCIGKQVMVPDMVIQHTRKMYDDVVPILLLTVAAIVNGAENCNAIANWGYRNEELLCWFGVPTGQFPGPTTLKRIYAKVNVNSFESILATWLHETFPLQQNELIEVRAYTGSTYVPGFRLLRSYQHIASKIVARLR